MTDESTPLGAVYAARDAEALATAYARWSVDYDRETAALGYCLPFVIAAWIARHVPKGAGPLLDAGCGTGLSGPYLAALGYDDLVGLDFSQEMLAIAAQRGCYRALARAELGKTLPWPNGTFAAVFSTGVFTEGHAPASSLRELARITRRGGIVTFTVRDSVFERGFADIFRELEEAGRWRPVDKSLPFRAFAVAEPAVLVTAFVFEVC